MNVGPALIADAQPTELVQPGQGPLHHPPVDAQPTAVGGQTLRQDWLDPQGAQPAPMGFRAIGSVSLNLVWFTVGGKTGPNPTDRRKPGSKHHVITDGRGIPLATILTGANRHDVTQLLPLVAAIPPVGGCRHTSRPLRYPRGLLDGRGILLR